MSHPKRPRHIGFIGDIHCGSKVGLWPVEEIGRKNVGAKYLMDCFGHLVESWPELDLLVLMGDLIDGKQRKSDGVGLFTADLGEQVAGAIEVLRPLAAKAKLIYRIEGTPYHEDFHNQLAALDSELNVAQTAQVMDIDLGTGILNVAHHPAGGSAMYTGALVDKTSVWSKVAAQCGKIPAARWIVRAHCHTYMLQDTETVTSIQNPCWQLPTAHAKKTNYYKFQSDIGGVLMIADDEEDSGYRFRCTRYPTPLPTITHFPGHATKAEASKSKRSQRRTTGARGGKKRAGD